MLKCPTPVRSAVVGFVIWAEVGLQLTAYDSAHGRSEPIQPQPSSFSSHQAATLRVHNFEVAGTHSFFSTHLTCLAHNTSNSQNRSTGLHVLVAERLGYPGSSAALEKVIFKEGLGVREVMSVGWIAANVLEKFGVKMLVYNEKFDEGYDPRRRPFDLLQLGIGRGQDVGILLTGGTEANRNIAFDIVDAYLADLKYDQQQLGHTENPASMALTQEFAEQFDLPNVPIRRSGSITGLDIPQHLENTDWHNLNPIPWTSFTALRRIDPNENYRGTGFRRLFIASMIENPPQTRMQGATMATLSANAEPQTRVELRQVFIKVSKAHDGTSPYSPDEHGETTYKNVAAEAIWFLLLRQIALGTHFIGVSKVQGTHSDLDGHYALVYDMINPQSAHIDLASGRIVLPPGLIPSRRMIDDVEWIEEKLASAGIHPIDNQLRLVFANPDGTGGRAYIVDPEMYEYDPDRPFNHAPFLQLLSALEERLRSLRFP